MFSTSSNLTVLIQTSFNEGLLLESMADELRLVPVRLHFKDNILISVEKTDAPLGTHLIRQDQIIAKGPMTVEEQVLRLNAEITEREQAKAQLRHPF